MINIKKNYFAAAAALAMFVLILDAKTVIAGATEGIELCLWTVIPSLFPFFIVSNLINGSITGKQLRIFRFLGKLCKIPSGSESIMLLGFVGGYPIGAQNVRQAYDAGTISKNDASRMLAFCNNAGPAFIFGMVSGLFESARIPWILWFVTILSAVLVARITPLTEGLAHQALPNKPVTLPQSVAIAIRSMANVCGWVITFRIILTVLQNRLLSQFPTTLKVFLSGLLELSNGVLEISVISDQAVRFLLCSIFLNFGGLCVAMQTGSVAKDLGLKNYAIGKVLQTVFSVLFSFMLMPILFGHFNPVPTAISAAVSIAIILSALFFKKRVAIQQKIVYNTNT